LWILSLAAFPVWVHFETPAWDLHIYIVSMRALLAGHDPYADAIAVQQLFHAQLALHPNAPVPYSYVYSPMTLPLLRLIGYAPSWLSGGLYWLAYAISILSQIWVGLQAVEPSESRYFRYLAPIVVFFPGLLASDIVLSGNVAYILYGLMLACALLGWRRGRWGWFYLAVLAASCVKAPLLSLVVIPPLSAPRQWVKAVLTALAGVSLFSVQPLLWAKLFQHYIQAVELQFSYNRDFGGSPAGIFSGFLFDRGVPYAPASYIFFLAYALPVFAILVFLSRKFLDGCFSLRQWIPVLLLGVILLNPRLIEYDVAPLALPLAMIAWRFLRCILPASKTIASIALCWTAANLVAYQSWNTWKITDASLLAVFFAAGVWTLLRRASPDAPVAADVLKSNTAEK